MLKIIKKSLFILKNNLIFIQPLLIYLLFLLTGISFILNQNIYSTPKILMSIAITLMTIAFTGGWFHIIKEGIISYNPDDSKNESAVKSINILKSFFEGVGANFLKTLGIYIILFFLYLIIGTLITKLCLMLFGEPKIIHELPKLSKAASEAEFLNIVNSFSIKDYVVISNWFIVIYIISSTLNFFTLLYFGITFFEKANIFKTFWLSIKFFFKNILNVILLMISIFVISIGLQLITFILGKSSIALVISLILLSLYLNYYILLVFCLYYDTINSNNGTKCLRENETGN